MASFAEGLAQGLQNLPLLMQRKKELDERQKQIDTEKDLKSADMLFKLMSNKDLPKSMKLNAYNQLSALNKKNGLGVNFPELTEWPDQADGFAKRGAKIFGSTDLSFQQKIEGLNGLLAEASDEGSNKSAEHIKSMMGELKATQARGLARAGEEIPFGLLDSIPKEERNDYLGLNPPKAWVPETKEEAIDFARSKESPTFSKLEGQIFQKFLNGEQLKPQEQRIIDKKMKIPGRTPEEVKAAVMAQWEGKVAAFEQHVLGGKKATEEQKKALFLTLNPLAELLGKMSNEPDNKNEPEDDTDPQGIFK